MESGARVRTAHADAWAAEGALRAPMGGGALALTGIRVMASGLPQPQWNGADVTAADPDLDGARAFYAQRGIPLGAISSWLLARGFADGARLAHLHADTDAAARVYARLGFVDAGALRVFTDV